MSWRDIPGMPLLVRLSRECYEQGNMAGVCVLNGAMVFLMNNRGPLEFRKVVLCQICKGGGGRCERQGVTRG